MKQALGVHNAYNKAVKLPLVTFEQADALQKSHALALADIRRKYTKETDNLLAIVQGYQDDPENLDSSHNHFIEKTIFSEMERISIDCTNDMIGLADTIVSCSIELLDVVPLCSFAVVAMGSLARGEATPYSDLEFLFVVEEKTTTSERYFEQLAMTIYFIIGNL